MFRKTDCNIRIQNKKVTNKLRYHLSKKDCAEELGAPSGAVYSSFRGGIGGTSQDLFEKAEPQLAEAHSSETESAQAYQMLAQGPKRSL